MSLGENISRLRAEQNMSQEALADALGVSRQSVSKWETDASVPELDKLIRLSEVFGVTLDRLARGEDGPSPQEGPTAQEGAAAQESQTTVVLQEGRSLTGGKVAGIVLLSMGFLVVLLLTALGSPLAGLIFASPFLLCGTICLIARRRVGLWCGWAVFFLVDTYFRYAAGLNWRIIRLTPIYEPSWNYTRLAVGWVQFLVTILLVVLTVFSFRRERLELTRRRKALLILGWAVLLLGSVLLGLYTGEARMYAFFLTFTDNIRLVLLTVLLTATFRVWRTKRSA